MKIYGMWDAFLAEQLAEQGDVSGYLFAVIEEYQTHGNITTVQIALRSVVEAQGGISELIEKIDIDPQVLLELLDSTKAPKTDTLRTVLNALGCRLQIEALETVNTPIGVTPETGASSHNLD